MKVLKECKFRGLLELMNWISKFAFARHKSLIICGLCWILQETPLRMTRSVSLHWSKKPIRMSVCLLLGVRPLVFQGVIWKFLFCKTQSVIIWPNYAFVILQERTWMNLWCCLETLQCQTGFKTLINALGEDAFGLQPLTATSMYPTQFLMLIVSKKLCYLSVFLAKRSS